VVTLENSAPDNVCRNGYFTREIKDYRLAKIKDAAADRIYFHGDGILPRKASV